MTFEILELMERRRLFKNKTREYMNIQQEIRAKIRTAKEKQKVEKLNYLIGLCTRKQENWREQLKGLHDNQGRVTSRKIEVNQTWKEYIKHI